MVGQAGAGSSRTDQPKARLQAASEDWSHFPCRRQPASTQTKRRTASTQTRRRGQHHSEEFLYHFVRHEAPFDRVGWKAHLWAVAAAR
jgi:hypothetical protein